MLTFEKIRELERLERESKDMVKLPDKFMDDVSEYLARKKGTDDREFRNIESTLKRLFEHRENKLVELVLYAAKTGMPVANIASHENAAFESMLSVFSAYRRDVIERIEGKRSVVEQKIEKKETKEYFRVKRTLKSFVGPDLNIYQLKENDMLEKEAMPKVLRELLIKEGILERVVE